MLQKILCNISAAVVVWSLGSAQLSPSNYHTIKSILFSSYSRNHDQFLPVIHPLPPPKMEQWLCTVFSGAASSFSGIPFPGQHSHGTEGRCYGVPWQLKHFHYIAAFSSSSFFLFIFFSPAMLPHRACSKIIIFSITTSFRYLLESAVSLFLMFWALWIEIWIFQRHNFPPDWYPEYFAEICFFRCAWAFKNIFWSSKCCK